MTERRFVLFAHRVPPDGPILLNDLAGASGRIDVVARSVTSALLLSHGMRRDTVVTILVGPPGATERKVLRLDGRRLQMLNPDERSTAGLLGKALGKGDAGRVWSESTPGLEVRYAPLLAAIEEACTGPGNGDPRVSLSRAAPAPPPGLHECPGPLVLLDERGELEAAGEAGRWAQEGAVIFVLSDHEDLSPLEVDALEAHHPIRATLGPTALQGHHCVTLVHWLLDRAGPPGTPPPGASARPPA